MRRFSNGAGTGSARPVLHYVKRHDLHRKIGGLSSRRLSPTVCWLAILYRTWVATPCPPERSDVVATDNARELARVAAQAAADKKAQDLVLLDVSEQLVVTDCFVIASAPNERQVESIVESVEEKMRAAGTKPVRREGAREGRWVLLDFVDVVVHVQHVDERAFYGLERLWKDCPRVDFEEREADPDDESEPQSDRDHEA